MFYKITILIILFFIDVVSYGQKIDYKVQKKIYNFIENDTIISMVNYYKGGHLCYAKEYAYNGWQIIDSISYDENLCFNVYQPNYDVERKIVKNYSYSYSDCYKVDYRIERILLFKDSFMILENYYSALEFALMNNSYNLRKLKKCYIYEFKVPASPSLFSNYGIPNTEVLLSLSVKQKQGLILEDEFNYLNFNIKRKYNYIDDKLMYVKYTVWNKQTQSSKIYYDIYKYFRI